MRDEFPALTKALIAGARLFSRDLDKCIEKEQRARVGLAALMEGLSELRESDPMLLLVRVFAPAMLGQYAAALFMWGPLFPGWSSAYSHSGPLEILFRAT
jgi:hypothetical protein